jgi:hypothetical protein
MGTIHHFIRILRRFWPIILLGILEAILVIHTYKPGTFVVGWDNMFPEFDFALNFKRTLTSVWQEYRGLGYEDGMSHAANLPHFFAIFLLSFVFKLNQLRYAYIFLTHLAGGVGIFYLLSYLFNKKRAPAMRTHIASFTGALVYQYCLATIQIYYLPFEPFITHFAFLPWLFLSIISFLDKPSRRGLIIVTALSFLSSSQAHVPTVFIVYAISMAFFLFSYLLLNGKKKLLSIALVILVSFTSNAYWGIPFLFATTKNAYIIANSKNNEMGTDDIFLQNHQYGDIINTALEKSVSLDFVQYNHETQTREYMMKYWKQYLDKPFVVFLALLLAIGIVLGILGILIRKEKDFVPFVLVFFLALFMIGNNIPILASLSEALRTYIPLFHNVFRFVYTKFFVLYAFSSSIFFAYLIFILCSFFRGKKRVFQIGILGIITAGMVYYSLPSWQGYFLHPQLRVTIPKEYFDLFSYLKTLDESARIAILPAPWYWSWTQYRWGVIGSGFTWFGIKQPTLDRAFDPWSNTNENFYWEVSQALSTGSPEKLDSVLHKYAVSYLLYDDNIIFPDKPAGALSSLAFTTQNSLSSSIHLVNTFGKIRLYSVTPANTANSFVSETASLPNIQPLTTYTDDDQSKTAYMSDEGAAPDIYYPFRTLFTGKSVEKRTFTVERTDAYIDFIQEIPKSLNGYYFSIPYLEPNTLLGVKNAETNAPTEFFPALFLGNEKIYSYSATNRGNTLVRIPNQYSQRLTVRIPLTKGYYSYDSTLWNDFSQVEKSCDPFRSGTYTRTLSTVGTQKKLHFTSINSSNCINFYFPYLPQKLSYLLTVTSSHTIGKGFFLGIISDQTKRTFEETTFPGSITPGKTKATETLSSYSFVIPPLEQSSLGYSIVLDNTSIGPVPSINDLYQVTIDQIPYPILMNLQAIKPSFGSISPSVTTEFTKPNLVFHPYSSAYWINTKSTTDNTTVLWQGYNPGWKLYRVDNNSFLKNSFPFFFAESVDHHVMINNWANGWIDDTPQGSSYSLFFLPQLYEWIGFILLPIGLLLTFFVQKKTTHNS